MLRQTWTRPLPSSSRHLGVRTRCPQRYGRQASSSGSRDGRPFRMAVIGSGPAGFYTAYRVMAKIPGAKVDMYERLPVPFGLVRFGVAPDHPEVKNCEDKFTEVASSPDFNFVGNIDIGNQLSLDLLKENHHAILFSYGASEDKRLGLAGEDILKGVYSARQFVGWYNGLPEHAALEPDLSTGDTAIVVGQGNVALDVARILLTNVDVLRKTDITDHALSALANSRVKHVHVIGRRGPMQAAFTIKEVRELMHLPDVSFALQDPSLLPPVEAKLSRTPRRLVTLLRESSKPQTQQTTKSWSIDSLLTPVAFESNTDRTQLKGMSFGKTRYRDLSQRFSPAAAVAAVPDEQSVTYDTSLAFRSIGYRSTELEGMTQNNIPFDHARGIVSNDGDGRVVSVESSSDSRAPSTPAALPGLYCAGWVKRGPAGVIANTMEDSFATADAIIEDWEKSRRFLPGGDGWSVLSDFARARGLQTVSWADWLRIDAAEKARGQAEGRARSKFTSIRSLLAVLD